MFTPTNQPPYCQVQPKVYIVYMGSLPTGEYSPTSHHLSLLEEIVEGRSSDGALVRSYNRSFNAFAARLSHAEVERISGLKEVVSVFRSRRSQLLTTRSWDFMGFPENVKRNPTVESNIIIGVIDAGIWPESESFADKGFGPPPAKWKGTCAGGKNFTCNNKIIGARVEDTSGAEATARDNDGHGSHTASTAAGNTVSGANFYGLAQGNARGAVPSARIAVYMACEEFCDDHQILAAFDDAIADGVDIITISIGKGVPFPYEKDTIAIGAFHAMEKGILTVQAAGNSGPDPFTVSSHAPWIISVAASSTDRRIIDKIVLGNGQTFVGSSVNSFALNGTKIPLIYGKAVTSNCTEYGAWSCWSNCMNSSLVKGKIVICNMTDTSVTDEALRARALGSIMLNDTFDDVSIVVPLPASSLNPHDSDLVMSYLKSTKNPQATILKSEVTEHNTAPVVASFSSRGPNKIAPEILKPDISAPGVEILAAYSPVASPSDNADDKRSVKYNVVSGTSMSCPHVAGAAAYVKSFHPNWSPSAITSALMTTALPMNTAKHADAEFGYGAGHINPIKAVDPGFLYEATRDDYIRMLCSMNNTHFSKCPRHIEGSPKDLNYPSMAVRVEENRAFTVKFPRTVRNVGLAKSSYKSNITTGSQINVMVEPSILSFKSVGESQSFVVTVAGKGLPANSMVSSSLVWNDGTHSVRSPIVVYTIKPSN
ncbi:PREDICTED: cucumisin-like isoform X1 [Populus euphratica]|uniref:Cucumisin-like isoform X1 n=2 Tax=Populus euphratica TaxID=75702 RepID=A0AAJ6UN72_POPEU|nr:PREDICTED: cucumisin-like isoform X1 [Populus euphratica]